MPAPLTDAERTAIERACERLILVYSRALDLGDMNAAADCFAVNGTFARPLTPDQVVEGREAIGVYRAELDHGGRCEVSTGERNFCTRCGTALWLWDPTWPDLVHPFASAIAQ